MWGHIRETPRAVMLLLIALGASMLGLAYATYRWQEAERRVEQLEREVRSAEEINTQRDEQGDEEGDETAPDGDGT